MKDFSDPFARAGACRGAQGEAAINGQEGSMATDLMAGLRKYNFTDELGHPLENCIEFQALIARIQNDVKAACPSIPPAPAGHFHAEEKTRWGVRTLEIFADSDGEADVTITTREDTLSFYLTAGDIARLRAWLHGQGEQSER